MLLPEIRFASIKNYSISREQLDNLIAIIPSLKENNKSPEFLISVRTLDDGIAMDTGEQNKNFQTGEIGTINIRFSYDFVNNRWFLTDTRIEIIEEVVA